MITEGRNVKIGPFKKIRNAIMLFAAKLQKQFFFEKTATFTITKLNEAFVKTAVESYGLKEGMNRIYRAGEELGHEFMVELAAHMVSDLKASPTYAKAAWNTFSGHSPSHLEFKEIEIDGHQCYIVTFRDDDCPWCRNISFETHFCAFPAGAYNGATATWAIITGTPLKFIVRETKCKAVGDEYCEFVYLIVPENMPIEVIKNAYPKWFEIIEEGYYEY